MKKFRMQADCWFEAEDIDDALIKLAKHHLAVVVGEESDFISLGTINIEPVYVEDAYNIT